MTTDHKQVNSTVKYQLVILTDEFRYPVRDTWEEAADDAVKNGWAEWEKHVLKLKDEAKIERVRETK